MRVFQINTVYGIGSTGRIVEQLKHMIEMQGDECMAAYGRGETNENNTFKVGTKIDLYVHAFMTRLTDKAGFYSKKQTKKMVQKIIEFNPDVIHLHNLHGYYLNLEFLFEFLKEYDKPVLWTLHDCWAYTGHCAHYTATGCYRWKHKCEHCSQLRTYPTSILVDNSLNNYLKKKELFCSINDMHIITPSNWLKEEVRQSFLNKYDVNCIYNGIDLEVFKPTYSQFREEYNIKNEKIILGVASVWTKQKRLQDFVSLAEVLPKEYKIVLVGVSKKQAKTMPDGVLCIEKTESTKKLAEIYTTADIYFNASLEETMGLTTVEAMACGTPVIVVNSTASPELVGEGCGYIVKSTDINEVLKIIRTFKKTEEMSQKCIKWASEFDKKKKIAEYLDLYRRCLK